MKILHSHVVKNRYSRHGLGFSLLEIVVAIAVLLVLVLLLIPMLRDWKGRGDSLQCLSNLRNVGKLLIVYSGDNNGVLDMHTYLGGEGSSKPWADYLVEKGYMEREDSMQLCQSEKPNLYSAKGRIYGTLAGSLPVAQDPYGIIKQGHSRTGNRWINHMAIERPSEYWILVDSYNINWQEQVYVVRNTGSSAAHLRHMGKANLLFADGHVESLDKERLAKLPYNPIFLSYDENYNATNY